jgi:hypothetical protein
LFFSTGPFFGFGKKFVDDTYAYLPIRDSNNVVSDSSQFKLANTGASKVPPGIGAFAHFGTKFSSGFGVGITTGVGLTIENNPRPIYFLGPNISLGDNNQFNISGGCAITQVEKVKSELYPDFENTIFETKPTAGISYSKKTATGWFVSLSYTVFTMNKTRNSSSKSKK